MATVCYNLFTHYVAYEADQPQRESLNFIKDCMLPIMTSDESQSFYYQVIETFLNKPEKHFSQKAVLEALDQFNVPESDLIMYMATRLGLGVDSSVF